MYVALPLTSVFFGRHDNEFYSFLSTTIHVSCMQCEWSRQKGDDQRTGSEAKMEGGEDIVLIYIRLMWLPFFTWISCFHLDFLSCSDRWAIHQRYMRMKQEPHNVSSLAIIYISILLCSWINWVLEVVKWTEYHVLYAHEPWEKKCYIFSWYFFNLMWCVLF